MDEAERRGGICSQGAVIVNGDVVRVTHAVRKQPCDSAHSPQLTAAHCCHYTYMQAILNITIELHVLNREKNVHDACILCPGVPV